MAVRAAMERTRLRFANLVAHSPASRRRVSWHWACRVHGVQPRERRLRRRERVTFCLCCCPVSASPLRVLLALCRAVLSRWRGMQMAMPWSSPYHPGRDRGCCCCHHLSATTWCAAAQQRRSENCSSQLRRDLQNSCFALHAARPHLAFFLPFLSLNRSSALPPPPQSGYTSGIANSHHCKMEALNLFAKPKR